VAALKVARRPDQLGAPLAGGLVWLATGASINMAVMAGLMPFAGNALPLSAPAGRT
jgi:cell division protein FtsW (lipid II flippase)